MTAVEPARAPGVTPDLTFTVIGAAAIPYAAAPSIGFALRIESDVPVRAAALTAQIRIAPAARGYDPESQARLMELFGEPERWATNVHGFVWTHAALPVGPFDRETDVTLSVACTYDFDVSVVKYLDGLRSGEIPLEFLFSGNVFYRGADDGLQTCRLSWDKEASYRMPVSVWRDMMDSYFPDTAWLRLGREQFDRLYAFRCARGLLSWEATLDALLPRTDNAGAR